MDFLISDRAPGSKRSPGLVEVLYMLKSDIATLQTPTASPTTQAEKVTIDDAHVPVTDEGFRAMYISARKSEHQTDSAGDEDAKSAVEKIVGFIPGITPEIAAFLYDDPELIILVPNGPCGTSEYRQLGTKCEGVKIKEWKYSSKKFGGTEAKGVELTLEATQTNMLFYTAAVPLPA